MIKTVNFLRFLSIVLFLIILGLVYAFLPITVQLTEETNQLTVHKSSFFYYTIAFFLVVNLFVTLMTAILKPLLMRKGGDELTAWFNSLSFVINIYFTLLVGFVGVLNNQTHVSISSYAYLNYLGPLILASWIIGFFYLIVKKKPTS